MVGILAAGMIFATPSLQSQLENAHTLAGVPVGISVAEFIEKHPSKEETADTLGPEAKGFRRFRLDAKARPEGVDDVVVFFRENQAFLVTVTKTLPAEEAAGTWSALVSSFSESFGVSRADELPVDREKMLVTFSLAEKGKSLKRRETAAWNTRSADLSAIWLEDAWGKKRTYVVALSRKAHLEQEAKTHLNGLFISQKSFFGEFNTYTTDLAALYWQQAPGSQYAYGFCNEYPKEPIPGVEGYDPARNHSLHPGLRGAADERARLPSLVDPCRLLADAGIATQFAVTASGFKAFAVANLDADADLDVWSIDHTKKLEHVRSDAGK